MKWENIDYFLAVSEHRNFSRAAEALFMTQSALSKQIAAMEEELGIRLFERDNKRVSLSPAGEYLLKESKKINARIQNSLLEAQKIQDREQRELDVDCIWDCMARLSEIIGVFNKAFPDVRINMLQKRYQFPLEQEDRRPDLVMRCYDREEKTGGLTLFSGRERLVLNRCHPLSKEKELSLRDLSGTDLVILADYPPHIHWKRVIREAYKGIGLIEAKAYNDLISALITRPLETAFIGGPSFAPMNFSCFVPLREGRMQDVRLVPCFQMTRLMESFLRIAGEYFSNKESL